MSVTPSVSVPPFRPMRTGLWVLAILGQLLVAAVLLWTVPTTHPVEARLIVVGPAVVSSALADQANALPGRPFDAVAGTSPAKALHALRTGRADAVILVDLTADTDTLRVSGAAGQRGATAIAAAAEQVSGSLGRGLDLVNEPVDVDRRVPYLIVTASLALGFVVALVLTWRRGSFETTFRAGVGRFGVFIAVGAAAALACWWLPISTKYLIAALVIAAGMTTTALTTLIGVWGLGVATLLFVLLAAPLARFTPPFMLSEPWRTLSVWAPHGAGLDLANAQVLFAKFGSWRSWAVIDAWILISVLVLTLSRRSRPPVA